MTTSHVNILRLFCNGRTRKYIYYDFRFRNGGGAFLIPFAIMMVIVGVPLFYMEASIGQFTSSGPMTCWKFAPLFKGK